jgi:hypothetical protein
MVYLQIFLNIEGKDRPAAAAIYSEFKGPFLAQIDGALAKELLIRDEEVQVLHRFESASSAKAYLASTMFNDDVVTALMPLLKGPPDIRMFVAL